MRSEASHHAEPMSLPCLASSNARRTAVPTATPRTLKVDASFDDIPDTWFCPVCGARKKDFVPYEG